MPLISWLQLADISMATLPFAALFSRQSFARRRCHAMFAGAFRHALR